ncbi:hypothetical protein H6G35_16650 [Aulosira sp. FACHB-113]|nr:hypothetical protein [Aulosira sp. FACHB-113]
MQTDAMNRVSTRIKEFFPNPQSPIPNPENCDRNHHTVRYISQGISALIT